MTRLLHILSSIVLVACTNGAPSSGGPTAPSGETAGKRIPIDGLEGSWVDVQDSGRKEVHEHWTRDANGILTGFGWVLSGRDTVQIEHMALLMVDDTLHYAARTGSGSGEAVLFKLTHDRDSLVFTAPAHDMPQRIVYVPRGPDAWDAIVSGTNGRGTIVEHYRFKRMRTPAGKPA